MSKLIVRDVLTALLAGKKIQSTRFGNVNSKILGLDDVFGNLNMALNNDSTLDTTISGMEIVPDTTRHYGFYCGNVFFVVENPSDKKVTHFVDLDSKNEIVNRGHYSPAPKVSTTKVNLPLPISRQTLIDELNKHVLRITFVKVDNTTRVMECTLNSQIINSDDEFHAGAPKVNQHVVAVWDLENEGWRSIRVNYIKEIEVIR